MIYTLDLLEDLRFHRGGAGDLARLCTLVAEGRLDGRSTSTSQPRAAATASRTTSSQAAPTATT